MAPSTGLASDEGEASLAPTRQRYEAFAQALIGVAAAVALGYAMRFGYLSVDTLGVVKAADWVLGGLRSGDWPHGGSHFPLLQTIPTIGLRAAGLGVDQTRWGLALLSAAAFVVLLGIAWRSLERLGCRAGEAADRDPPSGPDGPPPPRPGVPARSVDLVGWGWGRGSINRSSAIFFLAVLLSGPLAWYATSSFGEMLAALVTLAMVAACRHRPGSVLFLALFVLAGLSKDTAFPFLLLLGFGASVLNPAWMEPNFRRRRLLALAVGTAVTLAVIGIYNFARFGTVVNALDSDPRLFVPALRDQASFFLAIWLSPNGGVIVFWPSFGVLLGLVGLVAVRFRRGRGDLLPAGIAALVLLGLTAGFAKWWSPLGWWAWGPRLMLPWLPAIGYLLVAAYGRRLERLLSGLVRPAWRFWSCSLALAAVTLPQYVVLFRPSIFYSTFAPDSACPTMAIVDRAPGYYYSCVNHQLWASGSVLGQAYLPAGGRSSLLLGLACAGALAWLLSLVRRACAVPDEGEAILAPMDESGRRLPWQTPRV